MITRRTLLTLSIFCACAVSPAMEQHVTVATISENAAVRSDRRPVHVGFHDARTKRTFICWMGADSHPVVKQLDHATGRWSTDKVVARAPFVDKHNYPAMLRGPDDRIYVFHGCHNSPLKLAVSPQPLSIEGSWADRTIAQAPGASYPAPIVTADGVFYVFYRETRKTNGHSDDRPYDFVKSSDLGQTWTHGRFADPYPRMTDNMCEVYNGKVSYQPPARDAQGKMLGKGRVHVAWTICGEKLGRHAHATYGRNVYYAWLDPANDHIYNVQGRDLGTTIDAAEADAHCLVLDTGIPRRGHAAGLQVSAHYRDDGTPIVYFNHRDGGGLSTASWRDGRWRITPIGVGAGEPRELEKIGPDAFRVYRPDGPRVRVLRSDDAGGSWVAEPAIDVGRRVDRVYVIDDFAPEAKLLITEAGDGTLTEGTRDVFIGRIAQ
jgi:hypothetical protein